jgi:hypothetical protein
MAFTSTDMLPIDLFRCLFFMAVSSNMAVARGTIFTENMP